MKFGQHITNIGDLVYHESPALEIASDSHAQDSDMTAKVLDIKR